MIPQNKLSAAHLSTEQLGELLDASAPPSSVHHVESCAECAAELESLREALSLFRESTTAYANQQLANVRRPELPPLPVHRPFGSLSFAWAAAGLLVIAGLLPLQLHRQRADQQVPVASTSAAPLATSDSDEALLEDVNRELSDSVPASMQALADPTDSATATDTQTATSRKN